MKVKDLKIEDIKVGMIIKGLKTGIKGTVTFIDKKDDNYAWILWENEKTEFSGFYGNNCECEVLFIP